jgi:hypothetical protein
MVGGLIIDFTNYKDYAIPQTTGGSRRESYTYKVNGALQSRTRQSGKAATYSYTSFGQVSGLSCTDVAGSYTHPVAYAYDPYSGRGRTTRDAGRSSDAISANGQAAKVAVWESFDGFCFPG